MSEKLYYILENLLNKKVIKTSSCPYKTINELWCSVFNVKKKVVSRQKRNNFFEIYIDGKLVGFARRFFL